MWLINARTYRLESFFDSGVPPYAILSPTWGDDELTFQGIQHPYSATWSSFEKVRRTCQLALEDGLGQDLADRLSEITGIGVDVMIWSQYTTSEQSTKREMNVLRGALSKFSIAQRMSWAASRKTSRLEDVAYSLLGIFDVNMTLLYGEGDKAFARLQEEIIKKSTDHSIFAWEYHYGGDLLRLMNRPPALLAEHPTDFSSCKDVVVGGYSQQDALTTGFDLTNQGLRITLPIVHGPDNHDWGLLNCKLANDLTGPLGLCLRKTGTINVYKPGGISGPALQTMALPREFVEEAIVSTVVIVLDYNPEPRLRLDGIGIHNRCLRVNVIDDSSLGMGRVAQALETWPSACVKQHPELFWRSTSRAVPHTTITPPGFTGGRSAQGVRIALTTDLKEGWEAFYDLIYYNRIDRFLRPAGILTYAAHLATSSLESICKDYAFAFEIEEDQRSVTLAAAGQRVDALVSTISASDGLEGNLQIDLRITAGVLPFFLISALSRRLLFNNRAGERVEIAGFAPKDSTFPFMARMVVRRRQISATLESTSDGNAA
ncbi:hypothetical protein LTR27_005612 [Elasticomyces elasticus]|nr:hypothetical protein LTR27_005612 [Elasticomyces elasticus]